VGEVEMVDGGEREDRVGAARCVRAAGVAEVGAAPRLVQRDEQRHPVPERGGHDAGVLPEALRGRPCRPAARVLQGLREVPVVEGDGRGDPRGQQRVDQRRVERQPLVVDGAERVGGHLRGDPGPGHREPVRRQTQGGHERDVVGVAVVVVVGDVAGVAVRDEAGRVREGVPDRRRAPALGDGALDLVGRGRCAPEEAGRKGQDVGGGNG
jgi:hypothetical protein